MYSIWSRLYWIFSHTINRLSLRFSRTPRPFPIKYQTFLEYRLFVAHIIKLNEKLLGLSHSWIKIMELFQQVIVIESYPISFAFSSQNGVRKLNQCLWSLVFRLKLQYNNRSFSYNQFKNWLILLIWGFTSSSRKQTLSYRFSCS